MKRTRSIRRSIRRLGSVVSVSLLGLAFQTSWAQSPPPAGEKVTGALLQTWLDKKFSYAGVHQSSGCVILNTGADSGRILFIRCPNGWAEKLTGTARVNGDSYCTSFPVPNTPPGEDCVTWHSTGQWKFEQRKGDALDTTVIVLPDGLTQTR